MRGHNLLGCKFMEDHIFLISFVQLIYMLTSINPTTEKVAASRSY